MVIRFLGFINHVIDYLNEHHGDRVFCFTMDNLNTHRNPIIFHAILSRGHKVVFRAPYNAVDGAIEYIFNTLHTLVEKERAQIKNLQDLDTHLRNIFNAIPSFHKYFKNVGFNYD